MGLFKNKYRIKSTRLPHWNYRSAGYYFVTICTENKEEYFGTIKNGVMQISEIGQIVTKEWLATELVRENVTLDEWVIMPNHLHGIIVIQEHVETTRRAVSTPRKTTQRIVSTALKSNSLGSIIGQFKSLATKKNRENGYHDFAWQPRYYDHIIRDEISLKRIRSYIRFNPEKWEYDRENENDISLEAKRKIWKDVLRMPQS